eukprot:1065126-Amphidinium_carterae.1
MTRLVQQKQSARDRQKWYTEPQMRDTLHLSEEQIAEAKSKCKSRKDKTLTDLIWYELDDGGENEQERILVDELRTQGKAQ